MHASLYMNSRLMCVLYAILAGVCGSLAGSFGKIGMMADDGFFSFSDHFLFVNMVRLLMIVMVVLSNIGVWLMYTRSLRYSSTLSATGISIASNYIFTALTGVILFAEKCSFLWACGTLSVMIGVIFMSI